MTPRAACLTACLTIAAMPAAAWSDTVSGTATYPQRIALPPSAVFEARVEEVSEISRADAAEEVIGSARIDNPGQPPIAFTIDVDPRRIDPTRRYVVRATLAVDGRVTMTTDRTMPVLTQGAGRELTLVLRVIGAPRPALVGGPLGAPFPKLPASFSGDLPCADCVALRYRLNLFADGSYVLGTKYVGRNDDLLYDLGRWSLAGDRLTLRGGREAPELLQVIDSRTLRKLDRDGRPVDSAHNATLVRTAQFEPLQPRLFMRGLYRHSADAATFSECLSGQTWPVAAIAEHGTLERETLKVRKQPGAPVVVSLDGHVAPRARSDGKGTQPTLVVERFVRAWPDQTCAPFGRVGPTDIDWTLIALDGSAIAASAGASGAPLLRLNSAGSTVTGFGGCNRLRGSYTLAGDALSFGLMASTRMACAAGMPEEQAFVDMLSRAGRWRLDDGQLVLVDAGGREIARFKAAASR